jgi:site-specific recombinase XerD
MDTTSIWISAPADAYRLWQEAEAVGADRKPFSARSRVQHAAMFERFQRHLLVSGATVATFGPEHIESFFNDADRRWSPIATTRLRYGKMLDRLCRHLVELGVRTTNPAAALVGFQRWPEDEPRPLYLDQAEDVELQQWVQPSAADDTRTLRNRAIVALFLAAGITAAELRQAQRRHVETNDTRPNILVPKRGPRESRRVTLASFSLAPLTAWKNVLAEQADDALLFLGPRSSTAINDVLLGVVVKESLEAIGFVAPDMSPRVLRNTFARRQLLSGRTNEEATRLLGLSSQRTVTRLRETIAEECYPT